MPAAADPVHTAAHRWSQGPLAIQAKACSPSAPGQARQGLQDAKCRLSVNLALLQFGRHGPRLGSARQVGGRCRSESPAQGVRQAEHQRDVVLRRRQQLP